MGETDKDEASLFAYLRSIAPRFTASTYNLMRNNCNNFSSVLTQFLVSRPLPQRILGLPDEILATPMGAMFAPMLEMFQSRIRDESVGHNLDMAGNGGGAPVTAPSSTAAGAFGGSPSLATPASSSAGTASTDIKPLVLVGGKDPSIVNDMLQKLKDAPLETKEAASRLVAHCTTTTTPTGSSTSMTDAEVNTEKKNRKSHITHCFFFFMLQAASDALPLLTCATTSTDITVLLPVVDLLRCVCTHTAVANLLANDHNALLIALLTHTQSLFASSVPVAVMVLRATANLLSTPGASRFTSNEPSAAAISDLVSAGLTHSHTSVRAAAAAVVHNASLCSPVATDAAVHLLITSRELLLADIASAASTPSSATLTSTPTGAASRALLERISWLCIGMAGLVRQSSTLQSLLPNLDFSSDSFPTASRLLQSTSAPFTLGAFAADFLASLLSK